MGHENAAAASADRVNAMFDADLLIVGMGPAGAVLAGLARQHGLTVLAVDQAPGVHQLPRAAVFHHDIMRIFQMLGAAESMSDAVLKCSRYRFLTACGETLLDFDLSSEATLSGWAESYGLHQPDVERRLRQRIGSLGVEIKQNCTFVELVQDSGGVASVLRTPEGEMRVRTRFVVGCDGAASTVRAALGITLFDYQFDEPWVVVDVIAADPVGLPQGVMQICDPRRPTTCMRMGTHRYRWEFMIKPGEDPVQMRQPETLRALVAPYAALDNFELERTAVYRFHGLVAHQWRIGRVLLAGDAAHQMPPFAGQGMCSSIRDAANLAWKLAYVIKGEATESLLDTYQQEREPQVRAIVEIAIEMGRMVCLLDENAAAERNAGMLARRASGATDTPLAMPDLVAGHLIETPGAGKLFPQPCIGGQKLDDILGAGPWLISRKPARTASGIASFCLEDVALMPFAESVREWLDTHAADSVLVRPDRAVFGTGTAEALQLAWTDGLQKGLKSLLF